MSKRIRIGDIIEIPTSKGLAYAQYAHRRKNWGALIRVLSGFYKERPHSFSELINQPERFVVFFPLQAAVSRRIFEVIAHEEVPVFAQRFPLFRAAGFVDRDGRVINWLLWNGESEWRVERLTDEQRQLPLRQVWNDTLLIQRIEEGWTPGADLR